MTVSARDVAAALRDRLPGLSTTKLHKLLYYCQGHHLAAFGEPLFSESIVAWDLGPVVSALWGEEKYAVQIPDATLLPKELDEAELNTVGYVISRYGTLSAGDLVRLTHSEVPWKAADNIRQVTGEKRAKIELDWIKKYFEDKEAQDDTEERPHLDEAKLAQWLAGAEARRDRSRQRDSREEIRARLTSGG
ncbi:hypothetical protein DPM19_23385 [Actinomadura craniellae]|uniref:Antitoxin SocA-like Panacea domain-containing protein n=1 Tax=Actinomadura craniellae TaxID=2231787 RepID=A0A365H1J0_9ACTN|nr:type II toxin-antitoxin system antitoxin SocA domain-containing protein [Actinomadura craniellae]RAY12951.1 hypothetical protein DPM19_23385 [Actinomadura craniellae]